MGYVAAKNEGEVWIRGPAVSQGYYKNPELTAQDFSDGWYGSNNPPLKRGSQFLMRETNKLSGVFVQR